MGENNTELIIYQTEDGKTKIDVHMENETVWLSLDQMAELFQRDKSTISKHIKNIFAEGELTREAVVANFATTATDGKTYQVDHYNLDVIISVGYRVKSLRGTQFRIWANTILKEYMIKGFAMNDDLLKKSGGGNYFDELLERIRDIRSSEKVFWRKVLDIYVASLNIMDAKILFSKSSLLVSKLFEPGTDGNRRSLEKHHLFPKAYLKSLGYPDSKINQMANYAFIDWKDNMDILDDAPSVYYPIVCEGKSEDEIRRMEEENALPHGWENMAYEDFLEERRKLMAAKIKAAYEQLKKNVE